MYITTSFENNISFPPSGNHKMHEWVKLRTFNVRARIFKDKTCIK